MYTCTTLSEMTTTALFLLLLTISCQVSAKIPVSLTIKDGILLPSGKYIGTFTSQLQSAIDFHYPSVDKTTWNTISIVNSSVLRYLDLQGHYFADAPLLLPSLFVLRLNGSLVDALNLTTHPVNGDTNAYPGLVTLNSTTYSAVLGVGSAATINASTHSGTQMHAVSILNSQKTAVRGLRLVSQWETCVGIRGGVHNEVSSNNVGGESGRTTPATRGVWALATSRAYVHHNHVHHADKHALDFDAYTGNSVAWENLCEDNKEQGIFVEETSHDNVIVSNTCRRNGHGIGVYTLTVGPVSNNIFFGNIVTNNEREGITAGGFGHDTTHFSQKNVFFANTATGNNQGSNTGIAGSGSSGGAQFNPMHGANQGDHWFGNTVVSSGSSSSTTQQFFPIPHENGDVSIFEP